MSGEAAHSPSQSLSLSHSSAPPTGAPSAPRRVAIVGAGPVGLGLALLMARDCPDWQVMVYDARPLDRNIGADPRALALSLGSLRILESLGAWPIPGAAAIDEVRISQDSVALAWRSGSPEVCIRAPELGVSQLGAVSAYGALVSRLQQRWQDAVQAHPHRLVHRFGHAVEALRVRPQGQGVEVQAAELESVDLAVVAEGGVFQRNGPAPDARIEGAPTGLRHDYGQTAWVGTVTLEGGHAGLAIERFTRSGPVALLPLPPTAGETGVRASLVWCTDSREDDIAAWPAERQLAVLNSLLPDGCGRLREISPLKSFALGLVAQPSLVSGDCLVRIGNAAQTLHPVAGQGLNLGLRDAVALTDRLRLRSRRAESLAQALQAVQWARAPDRWSTIAATDFLARSFTWQWPGLPWARACGLWAVEHLPGLKPALARQMMFGRR